MTKKAGGCVVVPPTGSMQECIRTWGSEGGEWPNNTISTLARFWSCGMVSRGADEPPHDHDPKELTRCRDLAGEAAKVLGPEWPLLRSGSIPGTHPFFVTAQRGAAIRKRVTEKFIKLALGGTLHPDARAVVEPFKKTTEWWRDIEEDAKEMAQEESSRPGAEFALAAWQELMKWFPKHNLAAPSFVSVVEQKGEWKMGNNQPRFIVGITSKGSLVGVATYVAT